MIVKHETVGHHKTVFSIEHARAQIVKLLWDSQDAQGSPRHAVFMLLAGSKLDSIVIKDEMSHDFKQNFRSQVLKTGPAYSLGFVSCGHILIIGIYDWPGTMMSVEFGLLRWWGWVPPGDVTENDWRMLGRAKLCVVDGSCGCQKQRIFRGDFDLDVKNKKK